MTRHFVSTAVFALLSSAAHADVFFSENSALSSDPVFRSKLIEGIEASCPIETQNSSPIIELRTVVREQKVDQGIVDVYYSSTFVVQGYDNDGMHPRRYEITVESAWYAGTNPTPYDYIRVESVVGCKH